MANLVVRDDVGGVTTLTLNRPDKLNALNSELFSELEAHLTGISGDVESVGLVVIRGAGKCFSAGLDLSEPLDNQKVPLLMRAQIVDRIATLPQPVVAAVHGYCYTGALEIALAADLIFSATSAKFADTHARWGLTPAWGMSQRLPRRIGRAQASRMTFTAATVTAEEALALGLVDMIATDDCFEKELAEFAASIIANSWFSLRASKQLMLETDGLPLAAGVAWELFRRAGKAPDFEARIARFVRK